MIIQLVDVFFMKPDDKRLELEKQAMAYQIDQTTDGNVDEKPTNPDKLIIIEWLQKF